jgi:hypothetical protein
MYRSCGTFLYQERLQQQNGDMRKRDGMKAMCIWLHLAQGRVYSSLSPPPLFSLFSLPTSNAITRAAGLRSHFRPPHPPPEDYGHILATSPKVEDGLHFGDCEYGS